MDLWMPKPDGIDVAKKLHGQVHIVLIAGVQDSIGADASLFACRFLKPVRIEELVSAISLIDRRSAQSRSLLNRARQKHVIARSFEACEAITDLSSPSRYIDQGRADFQP